MVSKKKVMLVEDDAFISDIYRVKLGKEGLEVLPAENGLEAMKILEKTIPDLVLLDIIMPYMDGMDVLKKMKNEEKWKKIPIILLSNLSEKEKIEEALGIGADDYLIKSNFTPSEVLKKVNSVLLKQ
jgi:DNA-binding response OmpR family regulator